MARKFAESRNCSLARAYIWPICVQLPRSGSRSPMAHLDRRQSFCLGGCFDLAQLRVELGQRPLCIGGTTLSVCQVFADDAEIFLQFFEVRAQTGEPVQNLVCAFLHFHAAQTKQDGLQICIKAVGRHGNDTFSQCITEKLSLVARVVLFDDSFVINVLGGVVHVRAIVSAFITQHFVGGETVRTSFHVSQVLFAWCVPCDRSDGF